MAMKYRKKAFFPVLDEQIAAYLRRNDMTQEELAKEEGMSPATFAAKRKGEGEFTITEMISLCDRLGLTLDEVRMGAIIEDAIAN